MFKIDTHVHTRETSPCGVITAREAVKRYKAAGYQGLIITDHYFDDYFITLKASTWEGKIDKYLRGYDNASEEGAKQGLSIFLGMEIRFTEGANDYLVYGATEQFLKENKELYKLGLKEFKKLVEKENILIIQAHPFRPGMRVSAPEDIHGVEVYNGNLRHNSKNDLALSFATENALLMTSGSDFHQLEDLARGGMVFDEELKSIQDFMESLRKKTAKELIIT